MSITTMMNQVVKVRREAIAACMTCPICDKLFTDATTISECLHTFCRKCIYKKLSDEDLEACPVCDIDLGCVPLEKLRPDHNMQDVRAKIFPIKRRKVEAPEPVLSIPEATSAIAEDTPSVTLPVRRKERSLSSLVVSTPRVFTQSTMTGRRTKARKASSTRSASFGTDKTVKKEEASVEDRTENSSSPEPDIKVSLNVSQNSPVAGPSSWRGTNGETLNDNAVRKGKPDIWNPLNYLVEVANRNKFNSHGPSIKSEPLRVSENEVIFRKTKVKGYAQHSNIQDDDNIAVSYLSDSPKPQKLRRVCSKKEGSFGETGNSCQAILDAAYTKREKRIGPIWFSLVASEEQEGVLPLPQISASYLRMKDGSAPVSSIQKYLMRKLDLRSEADKVRDELEQLLDDDDDMADLYLSRKLAGGVSSPISGSGGALNWFLTSPTLGSRVSRTSRANVATHHEEHDVEELEMLLEAYFMQIEGTLNKLTTLREYIDDTEDYINIQLDNHRNQLIQLELFLSSGTVCLSVYSLVAAIFGMNIPYTWKEGHGYVFKWVVILAGMVCVTIFASIMSYARHKGVVGS